MDFTGALLDTLSYASGIKRLRKGTISRVGMPSCVPAIAREFWLSAAPEGAPAFTSRLGRLQGQVCVNEK